MKRILVFVIAAVLLVGAAAPKEAKAEEYMTVFEVLDSLGIPYDESTSGYSYLSKHSYFMFYSLYDADGNNIKNYLYMTGIAPGGYKVSDKFYFVKKGTTSILSNYCEIDQFSYDATGLIYSSDNTFKFDNADYAEVVYANYDASFLSSYYMFSDVENDDIEDVVLGTVQLQLSDITATVSYKVAGSGFDSFYIKLLGSDTADGEFMSSGVSDFYTEAGTGSYIFNNLVPGYYYYANLLLNDGTVLATSGTEYVTKDDAEIDLEITESDAVITGIYTLSGGMYINAVVYLQKSLTGATWVNVNSNSSAVTGTDMLSCDAQDGYLYRLYVEYVCRNDDGVDISGTVESDVFSYAAPTPTPMPTNTPTPTPTLGPSPTPTPTLVPDPELMDHTADFSFIVRMVMLLMQDFPLNLFLVAVLICAGLVIFDETKRGLKKK